MKIEKFIISIKNIASQKVKRRNYKILLLSVVFVAFFFARYYFKGHLSNNKTNISFITSVDPVPYEINGICLHFEFNPKVFFSQGCLVNCNGKQFDMTFAPKAIFHIEEFINRYNLDFIRTNLTDIFLLKQLRFEGKLIGGAYCNSRIYIAYDTDYIETPVQAMMHSEFSSILMKNHLFPTQKWQLINDKNFIYKNNILEVLGKEETNVLFPDSLEAGFITEYAKTTLENDFNMIVMVLFTQEAELCELRRRYDRIDKKAELAIKFYESIGSGVKFLECKH